MKCPSCGKELVKGDIVTRVAPIGFYPESKNDSALKHVSKMLFGSKSAIGTDGVSEAGYCPSCNKVTVVFIAKKDNN